ncbi:MAG: sulfatase-like hydrolase/transferase [Alphaproteobacteria bacterium]|jgi:hypothetical protein|nr:sulfatase-like hydrolase/transferase [Alphaproteobacteria bacterium]MBT4018638.1 sulfatase-like hydrolase/transferase [Alphaproteobacteria bacterium]MBT5161676.1 sulfatase-like hydrolase/transferase [Alphaproteobacteria bacterium]MBT5920071.1 sulfatase-like hydrolase/transferase [Alphaproteobacteria bacterium]MBT6385634.1 sulfatase-like hydrolase/transferase [Alphaproteobacteria bacterium]
MLGQAKIGTWPLYPFVFAAHPVLALLLNNVSKVPLSEAVWPLLIIEGLALLVLVASRMISGTWQRAAIHTFLIVVLTLFLQRFEDALKAVFDEDFNIWIVSTVWITLLFLVWHFVRRSKSDFRTATLALNAAAILFVAVPIFGVGWHNWQVLKVQSAAVTAMNRPVPALTAPADGAKPDIWYIVLDRYARADVLKSHYNFDNKNFLDALTSKGFQVLDKSTANYQRTAHSLASTLNLDYLDKASKITGDKTPDWILLYRLLEDFKVWRALKSLGYKYDHLGSWWTPTAVNKYADRNFSWNVMPTFERFLWGHSLPGGLAGAAGWRKMDYRQLQCERASRKFDHLENMAADEGPARFVFAHFLMPHPPFVLRADGSCLSESDARSRSRRDNYIDQVEYTNQRLLDLVSDIRARSNRQSIIILQADEGPWPASTAGDEHTAGMDTTPVKWRTLTDEDLLEKQAIFHAIYLPEKKGVEKLPATMTPVNTFRLIFRHWFGANLPVLSDENYIYLNNNRVLGFDRVTDRLK